MLEREVKVWLPSPLHVPSWLDGGGGEEGGASGVYLAEGWWNRGFCPMGKGRDLGLLARERERVCVCGFSH